MNQLSSQANVSQTADMDDLKPSESLRQIVSDEEEL